jgi:hypothetical protein
VAESASGIANWQTQPEILLVLSDFVRFCWLPHSWPFEMLDFGAPLHWSRVPFRRTPTFTQVLSKHSSHLQSNVVFGSSHSMNDQNQVDKARRDFLKQATKGIALALSVGSLSTTVEANLTNDHAHDEPGKTVKTRAKIVILGAGAAGITIANLLAKRLDGASILIVDPRKRHLYQPGLTLVAAGVQYQAGKLCNLFNP